MPVLHRRSWRAVLLAVAAAAQACAHLPAASQPFDGAVVLNDRPLTVHFANAAAAPIRPLLLYTTGDGGWARKDLALYRQIVSWGYPTAGFSAPQYLKHLRGADGTTTPAQLGQDYGAIIRYAQARLGMPAGAPVILVGVSRGAGLEVIAAGRRAVHQLLGGVIAIALTKEEEYVKWFGLRRRAVRQPPNPVMVEVYDYLPRLGPLPIAVVQSTKDGFLPADRARSLFGPDTPTRRFRAVDAENHNFGGHRQQMYDAAAEALRWIMTSVARVDTR